jgi:hypothetical protein
VGRRHEQVPARRQVLAAGGVDPEPEDAEQDPACDQPQEPIEDAAA